jgi:hypothetical protein
MDPFMRSSEENEMSGDEQGSSGDHIVLSFVVAASMWSG